MNENYSHIPFDDSNDTDGDAGSGDEVNDTECIGDGAAGDRNIPQDENRRSFHDPASSCPEAWPVGR